MEVWGLCGAAVDFFFSSIRFCHRQPCFPFAVLPPELSGQRVCRHTMYGVLGCGPEEGTESGRRAATVKAGRISHFFPVACASVRCERLCANPAHPRYTVAIGCPVSIEWFLFFWFKLTEAETKVLAPSLAFFLFLFPLHHSHSHHTILS